MTILNSHQQKAVRSTSENLVIFAGAGSGKTFTVTERIFHLVSELKYPPESILALTFTNKAALEMKNRISKRIGRKSSKMWIRTFHSAGLKILRTFPQLAGLGSDFYIVSKEGRRSLIRNILEEQSLNYISVDEAENYISQVKNMMINIQEIDINIRNVYSFYEKILKEKNSIDFDDMIWKTIALLKSYPNIRHQLQNRFNHILIDEYQDINIIQNMFIKLIRGANCSICVVGDDDQCIYEWRGAKPEFIRNFSLANSNTEQVFLEENYRSSATIIDVANHFIKSNDNRVSKNLFAAQPGGVKPIICYASSEKEQALFIANQIKHMVKKRRFEYKDFAILCRINNHTQPIEQALSTNNIPYSGEIFWSQASVKRIIKTLYAINNPDESTNLASAVNFPTRVLDNLQYKELVDKYGLHGLSVSESIIAISEQSIESIDFEVFRKRLNFILRLSRDKETNFTSEIIQQLIEFVKRENAEKLHIIENDVDNLLRLLIIAEEFESTTDELILRDFLDYIESMQIETEVVTNTSNVVNVLTCHHSKGLEFPVVFVTGVQVGVFPNDYFILSKNDLEQERRLFYVAITRAMEVLFLSYYNNNSSQRGSSVRSFIDEIPKSLVQSLM